MSDLMCRGCEAPLVKSPGPGRNPVWCSPVCRGRYRYAKEAEYQRAYRAAHRHARNEQAARRRRARDHEARQRDRTRDQARRQTPKYKAANRIRLHHRRALKRAITVERVDPQVVFERDGWRCQLCQRRIHRHLEYPHPGAAPLDHIFPLSRGGTHEYRNVQAAHLRCNWSKGARVAGDGEQLRAVA